READPGDQPALLRVLFRLGLKSSAQDHIGIESLLLEEHRIGNDDRPRLTGTDALDAQHHLDRLAAGRILREVRRLDDSAKVHRWVSRLPVAPRVRSNGALADHLDRVPRWRQDPGRPGMVVDAILRYGTARGI